MKKIFIIAGESSGDHLGADLMHSLHMKYGNIEFRGIGGTEMLKAGLRESLFNIEDLALMGLAEILPKIPKLLSRINQTIMAIKVFNPDLVITIDSPDFSFRVQKALKQRNIKAKRVHYVAPTVWAWRPERARKIATFLDGLICLFPFEPDYFTKMGLQAVAVGHPVMSSGALHANGKAFRFRHMIADDQKVMGLFFGSRQSEMEKLAPVLIGVAQSLKNDIPDLQFIVPTIPRWQEHLQNLLASENLEALVTTNHEEKWDAFAACDAALAVSGTVALEISAVGVPHAILYRMNEVTWQVVKRMVTTQHAHLANIILKQPLVPEFIQEDAAVDKIYPVVKKLLSDPIERAMQKQGFAKMREKLQPDPGLKAADQAANFLEQFL